MFPPKIFISLTCLIVVADGALHDNASDALKRRVERAKPDEFICTGQDWWTGLAKFAAKIWPATPPKDQSIKVYLKTREIAEPILLNDKNTLLSDPDNGLAVHFQPAQKTVVIVHGFGGDYKLEWIKRMADAYLKLESVNVIIVDWGAIAKTKNFKKVAEGTIPAGTQLADLLEAIRSRVDSKIWAPIHMIGFSLGAHVVGIAADQLKERRVAWSAQRITGLDPAYPCFQNNKLALDKDDAEFVDVIHTNANKDQKLGFGTPHEMGKLDFYPNGGEIQPGCDTLDTFLFGPFVKLIGMYQNAYCSHARAIEYFIESLEIAANSENKKFWGVKWDHMYCSAQRIIGMDTCHVEDECQVMGINADSTGRPGSYYTVTGTKKPFSEIKRRDRWTNYELLRTMGALLG